MIRKFRMIDAIIPALPFTLRYDDPPAGDPPPGDPPPGDPPPGDPPPPDDKNKGKSKVRLTPEQQGYVNSLLAEERRKLQQKNEVLITQLETEKNRSTTSAAERQALEERIENLRAEFQSKDEIAQREAKKKIEDAEKARKQAEAEATAWKSRFETNNVENELTGAAAKHKAFSTEQVVTILKPKSRLVEVADDTGKPTGRFQTRVKLEAVDKDGNPTILDLTAEEAVKQMTEMPERYGNLFSSGAAGGLGGLNNPRAGGRSEKAAHEMDTDEYMAARRKARAKK